MMSGIGRNGGVKPLEDYNCTMGPRASICDALLLGELI